MFGGVRSGYSLRTKPGGPRRLLTFSGDPPPKAAGHLIRSRIAHRLGPSSRSAAPLASQLLYLAVHLVERLSQDGFQHRAPVVGEVAGQHPRLFQEHAHVL
jgi:hypothetical protein